MSTSLFCISSTNGVAASSCSLSTVATTSALFSSAVSFAFCSSASLARPSASAKAAASASFSFFDLRPLFLGLADSSAALSAVGSSTSLNSEGCSLGVILLFFTSKFSPSFPFTEYTLSVSFLTILVLFFFCPKGFFVPSSIACLSNIE